MTAMDDGDTVPLSHSGTVVSTIGLDRNRHNTVLALDADHILTLAGNCAQVVRLSTGQVIHRVLGGSGGGICSAAATPWGDRGGTLVALGERALPDSRSGPVVQLYHLDPASAGESAADGDGDGERESESESGLRMRRGLAVAGAGEQAVAALAFSPDRTLLAAVAAAPDYTLTLYGVEESDESDNGEREVRCSVVLRTRAFAAEVFGVRFSPFSGGALVTCGSGHIKFWRMARTFTGLKLQGAVGKFGRLEISDVHASVELGGGGGLVVSGSESGDLLIWEHCLVQGVVAGAHRPGAAIDCLAVATAPGARRLLISAGDDGYIRYWDADDLATREYSEDVPHYTVKPLAEHRIDPDAAGDNDVLPRSLTPLHADGDALHRWAIGDGRRGAVYVVTAHRDDADDGDESDPAAGQWVLSTGDRVSEAHGSTGGIAAVATAPLQHLALTAGAVGDPRTLLWDYSTPSPQLLAAYTPAGEDRDTGAATAAAWLPPTVDARGRTAVIAYRSGCLRLLRRARDADATLALRCLAVYKPHTADVSHIAVSPLGDWLVTAGAAAVPSLPGSSLFFFRIKKTSSAAAKPDADDPDDDPRVDLEPVGFVPLAASLGRPAAVHFRPDRAAEVVVVLAGGAILSLSPPDADSLARHQHDDAGDHVTYEVHVPCRSLCYDVCPAAVDVVKQDEDDRRRDRAKRRRERERERERDAEDGKKPDPDQEDDEDDDDSEDDDDDDAKKKKSGDDDDDDRPRIWHEARLVCIHTALPRDDFDDNATAAADQREMRGLLLSAEIEVTRFRRRRRPVAALTLPPLDAAAAGGGDTPAPGESGNAAGDDTAAATATPAANGAGGEDDALDGDEIVSTARTVALVLELPGNAAAWAEIGSTAMLGDAGDRESSSESVAVTEHARRALWRSRGGPGGDAVVALAYSAGRRLLLATTRRAQLGLLDAARITASSAATPIDAAHWAWYRVHDSRSSSSSTAAGMAMAAITSAAASFDEAFVVSGSAGGALVTVRIGGRAVESAQLGAVRDADLAPGEYDDAAVHCVPGEPGDAAAAYSIQQAKLQRERDVRAAQADARKAVMRQRLDDLRATFRALIARVPDHRRDPRLRVDPALVDDVRREIDARLDDTKRELARDEERCDRRRAKLQAALVDAVDVEHMEMRALAPGTATGSSGGNDNNNDDEIAHGIANPGLLRARPRVSSLRTRALRPQLRADLAALHAALAPAAADDPTPTTPGTGTGTGTTAMVEPRPLPASSIRSVLADLDDDDHTNNTTAKTAPTASATASGGVSGAGGAKSSAEAERLRQRDELRRQWTRLMALKPSETYEDANDAAAIAWAREHMGDYALKRSTSYVVPRHLRVNADRKRQQMMLLEESIYALRLEFNARFLSLRDLKARMVDRIRVSLARMRWLDAHVLADAAKLPLPPRIATLVRAARSTRTAADPVVDRLLEFPRDARDDVSDDDLACFADIATAVEADLDRAVARWKDVLGHTDDDDGDDDDDDDDDDDEKKKKKPAAAQPQGTAQNLFALGGGGDSDGKPGGAATTGSRLQARIDADAELQRVLCLPGTSPADAELRFLRAAVDADHDAGSGTTGGGSGSGAGVRTASTASAAAVLAKQRSMARAGTAASGLGGAPATVNRMSSAARMMAAAGSSRSLTQGHDASKGDPAAAGATGSVSALSMASSVSSLGDGQRGGKKNVLVYARQHEQDRQAILQFTKLSEVEQAEAAQRVLRAVYEKQRLQRKVVRTMRTFDGALVELRQEKTRLVADLKMAELRLVLMFRELQLLHDFERRDSALVTRLDDRRAEKRDIAARIAQCQQRLAARKQEVADMLEREKALMRRFNTAVSAVADPGQPLYDDLLALYRKKVPHHKKPAAATPVGDDAAAGDNDGGDGDAAGDDDDASSASGGSSASSSASYDSDLDDLDDSSSDGGEAAAPDVCPAGCDRRVFDEVLALRGERVEQEDAMGEFQKAVEALRKENEVLLKKERVVDTALQAVDSDIEAFQNEKQRALNELATAVPLKMHQVQYLCDDRMVALAGCGDAIVFTNEGLRRLRRRTGELQGEKGQLRRLQRELRKEHVQLVKTRAAKNEHVQQLVNKAKEVQILKFGQEVDLDILEQAGEDENVKALRQQALDDERRMQAKLKRWDEKIDTAKGDLAAVMHENTQRLRTLADLQQEHVGLQSALDRQQQAMVGQFTEDLRGGGVEEQRQLVELVQMQGRQIEELRAEIALLKSKGGNVYSAAS